MLTEEIVGGGGWVPPPELLPPPPHPARVIEPTRTATVTDDVKFERTRQEILLRSLSINALPLFGCSENG